MILCYNGDHYSNMGDFAVRCVKIVFLLLILQASVQATTAVAQTDLFCSPFWFCPDVDPATVISYTLLEPTTVTLRIVDSWSQQTVRTLLDEVALPAGIHQTPWDARDDLGVLLETRPFSIILSGDDWVNEDAFGMVICGDDLGPPVHEYAGTKDVTIAFWAALPQVEDAVLALYAADGVTLVDNLYSGPAEQTLGIIWTPQDAPGAPLPAGNYICRLTSSAYSEDELFYLDPVSPAGMTVVVKDGDDNLVTGRDDTTTDSAQLYGPLQEAWLNFERQLSAPEIEYLLAGGLRIGGVFDYAEPGAMVVAPDSASIHLTSFMPSMSWTEILGRGSFTNYGFLSPGTGRFRVGYHHTGITATAANCQLVGPADPADWQTEGLFNLNIPCPNPVAPGLSTEFRIGFYGETWTVLRVYDEDGNIVRTLGEDWFPSGQTFVWDLADNLGAAVPDGVYHLVWAAAGPNTRTEVVTAGDIYVWSLSGADDAIPAVATRPSLLPNHPNPFNPSTTISFTLGEAGRARLTIHAVDGSLIRTLLDDVLPVGLRNENWNGRDDRGAVLPSGVYFSRLQTAGEVLSARMLMLK